MAEKPQGDDARLSNTIKSPLHLPAHTVGYDAIQQELQVNPTRGLSSEEAATRMIKYGENSFGKEQGVQPLQIVIAQVANAMTLVRSLFFMNIFADVVRTGASPSTSS